MIISPSILASDFLNLEKEITALNSIPNIWVHLDIMDGHFVPNLTFGHEFIRRITNLSTNPCDAHFMVTNPDFYIETLKDSGLHNFTFHFESCSNHLELIKKAKAFYPSVGISIKPSTGPGVLSLEILKEIDLVLVMSVEPGFGGQSFMQSSIEKIKALKACKKKNNYNFEIQVDGGINETTSKPAKAAGATNLVAGSYVFKGNDYNARIQTLN